MLTTSQIADVAVARLALPVPMAKLQIMHDIAAGLRNDQSGPVIWDALLRWLKTRELESEVLEGLCAIFLAKGAQVLEISGLRLSIERPSILSDFLIAESFGTPLVVASWSHSHSEEVPGLLRLNEEIDDLCSGRFIPPLFENRLTALEQRSGKPFMRQWAYEFTLLRSHATYAKSGSFGYFRGDTTSGTGTFVGKQGHLARSAFLRTLALAVARWDMPQEKAKEVAQFALPAEPLLLKLLPLSPPSWAPPLHSWSIKDSATDLQNSVAQMIAHIEQHTGRTLLHFKGCIHSTKTMSVEAEVTTALSANGAASPEDVFLFYNFLLGKVEVPRLRLESFVPDVWVRKNTLPGKDGTQYLPALLPLIGHIVGYLSTDLLRLLPMIPNVHSSADPVAVTPEVGGMSIFLNGICVGKVDYWNLHWQPMHEKNSLPPSSVCTTLSADAVDKLFRVQGYDVKRCWKILIRERETDYGSWVDTTHFGVL
jgi:hypothetical protein